MKKYDVIIIRPDNNGWDISVYDSDGEIIKSTWSDNGQSAINKAFIFQDHWRNHSVILTHEYNVNCELIEVNKILRSGYIEV